MFDSHHVLLWTLILTRIGGLVAAAPVLATREIPLQVRGLLAFAMAALIMPSQWTVPVPHPANLVAYAVLVGGELLIGLALGLGLAVLFSGIEMAGQLIAHCGGLSAAEVFDPVQGENVPVLSRLMFLVTLSVFLLAGGHRIVVGGLLETFRVLPPGCGTAPAPLAELFVTLVAQSCSFAIRAAAPVVISLLVANLALGLIGRTLPQLNLMAVGFGINALLAFGGLMVCLGGAAWIFQDQVEPTVESVLRALQEGIARRVEA